MMAIIQVSSKYACSKYKGDLLSRQEVRKFNFDTINHETKGLCTNNLKHLPAVNMEIFLVNLLGLYLIELYRIKKLSLSMIVCKKNVKHIWIKYYQMF